MVVEEHTVTANGNMTAFLAVIKHSEGTDLRPDPYAVTLGYEFTITDFSNHPALLGWPGFYFQGRHDTGAGAYQITVGTWRICQQKMNLPDFSPQSQDTAAVFLIAQAGAMHLIDSGLINAAILKCSGIWASLPGSMSGQPQKLAADLLQKYTDSGGHLA